jgi:hypothetical protein
MNREYKTTTNQDECPANKVETVDVPPRKLFLEEEEYRDCEADFLWPIPTLEIVAKRYFERFHERCGLCEMTLERKSFRQKREFDDRRGMGISQEERRTTLKRKLPEDMMTRHH